ncbi:MAG: oligosaccharide flippase family protein [Candidatus Levybacteria bacterium]|nr:oligosaccharide flippase family protein [Candidatus Levybacteria bacterium]
MKQNLLNIGEKFIKHELITGSFYIFTGSLIANIFAFLFNLLLARNLNTVDYGAYASLLSLFILIGIPAQSITTVIIKFAADYFTKNKIDEAKVLYSRLLKLSIIFSIFIFLGFVLFSISIKEFLNLDNIWYVILTGFIVSINYLGIVNNAYLQSLLKFSFISFTQIAGGALKIAIGGLLVFLGFKVFAALWAIVLAFLLPLFFTFIPLRFLINKKKTMDIKFPTKEIIIYALPTTITILSLNSLTSIDIILVKHFFHAHDAGLYAGLSLAGKVIFYFTSPIVSVMFPLLIKRHNLGKDYNSLFYLALILVAIPSIVIMLFYFLFPLLTINFFLGGREYVEISPYLGIYGLFIVVFSLLNVCANFFLSLKKTNVFIIIGLGVLSQIILISAFHRTFFQVIGVSLIASSVIFIILLAYYFKEYGNFNRIIKAITFVNNPRN